MSMNQIIEDAAATIPDSIYLRSTDYDANVELHNIALKDKTLIVYNNLPVLNYSVSVAIEKQWPVLIKVLQLAGKDAKTKELDIIRESLVPVAEKLFKELIESQSASKALLPTSYTIAFLGELYDPIVTGVELAFAYEFNPIC